LNQPTHFSLRSYITLCALFIALFHCLTAEEDEGFERIDRLGDPSIYVESCVNIITGAFNYAIPDLVIDSPEPIRFTRYYNSNNFEGNIFGAGFVYSHPTEPFILKKKDHPSLYIADAWGNRIKYKNYSKTNKSLTFALSQLDSGIANTSHGVLSGRYNIKNSYAELSKSYNLKATVYLGDGTRQMFNDDKLLSREIRPSGNQVCYYYGKDNCLTGIYTKDPTGTQTLGWIKFSYDQKKGKASLQASNGLSASYSFSNENVTDGVKQKILNTSSSFFLPSVTYNYQVLQQNFYNPDTSEWSEIKFRRLKGVSGLKTGSIDCEYKKDKVRYLRKTHDRNSMATYHFDYDPKNSRTTVINPLGQCTIYRYSKNLISSKTHYPKKGMSPYRTEKFYWGCLEKLDRGTLDNRGNLITKGIADSSNNLKTLTHYQYDKRGNVISEILVGNLTGETEPLPITIKNDRVPDLTEREYYQKNYTYSDDGMNLVLTEEDGDGRKTVWQYLQGTDKPSARLTYAGDTLIEREFFEYNHYRALVKHVIDDGIDEDPASLQGVSLSSFIRYFLNDTCGTHGFGKPLEVIEGYLDPASGNEIPLKRTVYTYGKLNTILSQTLYDADDNLCYTLTFSYDNRGNKISETDPLGYQTVHTYNKFNQCTSSEKLGSGFSVIYQYDLAGRLCSRKEKHDSGEVFLSQCKYDAMGRKTQETDSYGNTTAYVRDLFGRVSLIVYPEIQTKQGAAEKPTEKKSYDIWDRVVKETNPYGHETHKTYTSRGQVLNIAYPDGTSETYRYQLNGLLHKKIEKNGTYTLLSYDDRQRVIEEKSYDANGEYLRSKQFIYRGQLLAFEVNAMGVMTEYQYDEAGRKTTLIIHGEESAYTEQYRYDTRGRLLATIKWYGTSPDAYTSEIQEYDNLDRVIVSRMEDSKGTTLRLKTLSYDINGNCNVETIYQDEDKVSVIKTDYTSYNLPSCVTDPEGNQTYYHYNFKHRNALNKNVLKTTVIDPHGNRTITVKDAFGRDAAITKENALGQLLSSEKIVYNKAGCKSCCISDVVVDGQIQRQFEVIWEYDSMNRPIKVVEDPQNANKITQMTYHESGALASKIKPNGTTLTHAYDPLLREISLESSDLGISYTYDYDLGDRLIKSTDQLTGACLTRSYDFLDHLTEETLPTGLTFRYEYDSFHRVTCISLPDLSQIRYEYGPVEMLAACRIAADGTESYRHVYQKTDWQGRSISSTLITGDPLHFEWDCKGRLQSLVSPYFTQHIPENGYDRVGNLLQSDYTNGPHAYSNTYRYDDLYQLTEESTIKDHLYANDSLHNRLAKDADSYEINTLNQIEQEGANSYDYDLNGNLTTQTKEQSSLTYSYDALNRLTSISLEGQWKSTYTYDSFGRRIHSDHFTWENQWIPEESRDYLYQGIYEIGFQNQANKIQQLKIMGKKEGPAFRVSIAFELNEKVFAPLYDHLFNVAALVDLQTGEQVKAYRYSAFGECAELTLDHTTDSPTVPWLFGNQRYDSQADLYHFGKRDYRPEIGRWISPDPGDFIDGLNLYAYTRNNPTTHIDFYGFATQNAAKGPPVYAAYGGMPSGPLMDEMVQKAARVFEKAAHHIIPSSQLQYCAEGVGRVIAGETFEHQKSWELTSVSGVVPGTPLNGACARAITGIMCPEENDAIAFAQAISKNLNGAEVRYTWHPSRGLVSDLITCLGEYLHIPNEATIHLSKELLKDYEEMSSKCGDGFTAYLLAHSRGGLETSESTRLLSNEVRSTMNVATFGSAKILSSDDYGDAVNYKNPSDIVNKIGRCFSSGYSQNDIRDTGYTSDSIWSLIEDHYLDCPGYQDALFQHCSLINGTQ
jgi:RHS repeat-associated protein